MEDKEDRNETQTPMWVRQARKRATTRTFVVPTDSKGRAILSFWVSATPRPSNEEDVNCVQY